MVDQNRSLWNTEAGKEVDKEIQEQRRAFEQLQEAIEERDHQHVDEILNEQAKFEEKLAAIHKGRDELRIRMENLIAEKDKQHIEEMTEMEAQLTGAEETLRKQVEKEKQLEQDARMNEVPVSLAAIQKQCVILT